ncbi:hypothetical protein ACRRTK_000440 [Alexandromys fortis]
MLYSHTTDFLNSFFFFFGFSRQGFSVVLEPVLELALVDQAGLELTEICLPLPPECWDQRLAPPPPGS